MTNDVTGARPQYLRQTDDGDTISAMMNRLHNLVVKNAPRLLAEGRHEELMQSEAEKAKRKKALDRARVATRLRMKRKVSLPGGVPLESLPEEVRFVVNRVAKEAGVPPERAVLYNYTNRKRDEQLAFKASIVILVEDHKMDIHALAKMLNRSCNGIADQVRHQPKDLDNLLQKVRQSRS